MSEIVDRIRDQWRLAGGPPLKDVPGPVSIAGGNAIQNQYLAALFDVMRQNPDLTCAHILEALQ